MQTIRAITASAPTGLLLTAAAIATSHAAAASFVNPTAAKIAGLFQSSYDHEGAGKYDQALNDVLQVLRLKDTDYVATLRAGWLYYVQGRYADSVAMYERTEVLVPDALEPKLGLMLPLMAARRWAEAELIGRKLIRVAPRDYTARSRLAWICFSQGRYRDAEGYYAGALGDYPSDVEMMRGLAFTYQRQGKEADAKALFDGVLQLRKDDIKATAGLQAMK